MPLADTLPVPTIREAVNADIEALVALLEQLFSIEEDFNFDPAVQRLGLQQFLDGCAKHRCILVAEIDEAVVGMVTAQMLISTAEGGPSALVEDMVVDRPWRARGIGRKLLQAIEAWAIKRGCLRLQLLADRNNHAGLDFYGKMGWSRTQLVCLRKMAGR